LKGRTRRDPVEHSSTAGFRKDAGLARESSGEKISRFSFLGEKRESQQQRGGEEGTAFTSQKERGGGRASEMYSSRKKRKAAENRKGKVSLFLKEERGEGTTEKRGKCKEGKTFVKGKSLSHAGKESVLQKGLLVVTTKKRETKMKKNFRKGGVLTRWKKERGAINSRRDCRKKKRGATLLNRKREGSKRGGFVA